MRINHLRGVAWILAVVAFAAHADPQYIHDKLVVSVYAEANQESEKLATLESGDIVEALEKADAYTRIRLSDGREGWIKSSYLTLQMPAALKLKEMEKERTGSVAPATPDPQLTQEVKQLKERNAALQSELASVKASPPHAAPAATTEPVGVLQGPETPLDRSILALHGWAVPLIALATGALGFLVGYQALARRIRRKYGSVKIY